MAKQIAEVDIHAPVDLSEDFSEISVDLIDDNLYLGNLECAKDIDTLKKLQITHVLTIDVVPLPHSTIMKARNITFQYIKLADVPKEDLITHLPEANKFIKDAIKCNGTVLVHCYFGVSRSAAVVVAYVMDKYGLCYDDALTIVRSKRPFVCPNVGFAAQLRLFGHMGCKLDREDPRYKQFRLRMAGQKLKQVKILPQSFKDLVKPDPGLARERPDPIVYRCKRCRRVVASQKNIIPHIPKQLKIELAKKGIRPPPSKLTGLHCSENGQLLMEKLKNLAFHVLDRTKCESKAENCETKVENHENKVENCENHVENSEKTENSDSAGQSNSQDSEEGPSQLNIDSMENLVDTNIAARVDGAVCQAMWFVEPMCWMQEVVTRPQGKLTCPKCANKIGSFSWVMGCKCPCGQKVAPAFYLVPSKVEYSNIVQNVQVTV